MKVFICLRVFPLFLQFAIVQFSSITKSHFSFTNFDKSNFKNDINNIQQLNGGTNTASAIQFVV